MSEQRVAKRPGMLRMVLAQTSVELRLLTRRGESVLITLIVPALILVFFAAVAPLTVGEGTRRPVDVLFPGALALAVMSTALVSLGIATAFERQYGVLKRLGGSPLPRGALIVAKLLSVVVTEMVQVVLLSGIALVLGWRASGSVLLAAAALVLGTAAFGGLGMWMAGSWRAEAALAGANLVYLLLLFLGGILVPLTSLPRAAAAVATLLPSSALAEVLRFALLPSAAAPPAQAMVVLCAWALLAPTLAAITFRWE